MNLREAYVLDIFFFFKEIRFMKTLYSIFNVKNVLLTLEERYDLNFRVLSPNKLNLNLKANEKFILFFAPNCAR